MCFIFTRTNLHNHLYITGSICHMFLLSEYTFNGRSRAVMVSENKNLIRVGKFSHEGTAWSLGRSVQCLLRGVKQPFNMETLMKPWFGKDHHGVVWKVQGKRNFTCFFFSFLFLSVKTYSGSIYISFRVFFKCIFL